jgi:phenylpyruvate tautomerase PptA (4-oxalocrotonate tautomerase family)
MPVVIKELVIRATVTDTPATTGGSGSSNSTTNANSRETLVKEITEQVLEVINKKKDR